MTDEHFEHAGGFPKTLEEINMNGCREISERTVMLIAKSCSKLKRIEFYWNCRLTDFSLKKMATQCKELEYVNLSGCKYLTDSSIIALSENCPGIKHFVRSFVEQ